MPATAPPNVEARPPVRDLPISAVAAILVILVFAAYFPATQAGFIWDDDAHVTKPELRSFHGLYRIWFDVGATQQYYPLLHSAFWLQHRLFGDDARGYHVVNIALHAAAAVLVLLVVRRLLADRGPHALTTAYLTAVVFALHPIQVESVAWITEQKNTLSALFYLASLHAYLSFDQTRRRRTYAWGTLLFLLGLATKTVTATLPAAILVIFWWKRGRLDFRRDVRPLLPWLAAGAAAGLFTAWVEHELIGAKGRPFELGGVERGMLAGRVALFYLGKLLWPAEQIFHYPRWTIRATDPVQWLYPVAALLLTAGLVAGSRRSRAPLAAWLFFVGTLFPVLGLLNVYPFIYSFVADHFQYLAGLGVTTLVCGGLAAVLGRVGGRSLHSGVSIALSILLASVCSRQCFIYTNPETLYRDTLRRNPDCWLAHNNLGVVLKQSGRFSEAIEHYRRTIALNPAFPEAHNNLAVALGSRGGLDAAIAAAREALRLRPANPEALGNLASLLTSAGRPIEAIDALRTALRMEPQNPGLHTNLALAHRAAGQLEPAIAAYRRSLELYPDQPAVRSELDLAQAERDSPERAISAYERRLVREPESVDALFSLAVLLAKVGRTGEAIERYERVLTLQPQRVDAHTNLAVNLARTGRLTDAMKHFEEATRLQPTRVELQMNLAVARASAGQREKALQAAERARQLAIEAGQPELVRRVDEWIARQAAPKQAN